jgi:hypothetical protein
MADSEFPWLPGVGAEQDKKGNKIMTIRMTASCFSLLAD